VHPGAKRPGVRIGPGGRVLVAVAAPPERGKANEAVVAALADALGLRPAAVTIRSGASGRTKQVRISGVTSEELAPMLARLPANVPR
jgi:uncharacterized protein YggU (UPF0235/DUF167 family)